MRTENEINDFLIGLRRKRDIVHSQNPTIVEQKNGKKWPFYMISLQRLIKDYTKHLEEDDYLFPSDKGEHVEVNTVYQLYQNAVDAHLGRLYVFIHTYHCEESSGEQEIDVFVRIQFVNDIRHRS